MWTHFGVQAYRAAHFELNAGFYLRIQFITIDTLYRHSFGSGNQCMATVSPEICIIDDIKGV